MRDGAEQSAERIVAEAFGCADDLAALIASHARTRQFLPRVTILHPGDPTSHVYLMLDGHAQAIAISPDGRAVLVQDFHQGDLFGELGLLSGGINAEEVLAVDTVDASQFRSEVFIGLMEAHASVALAVSRLVVARLYRTTRRMVEGATLTANGRVYAELLRLARAGDGMISPAPKISDLAMAVQTTRETASRAINLLERKGIILRTNEALTLVAPHRLEDLVV
jgi:CRP/FNR family transcriptional regulator, cyclic AMP receptor protein